MCIKLNIFDDSTLKILKQSISGITTKEITTEYVVDEETGDLKISKQKVNEKNLPPNSDLIKLIYQYYTENKVDYNSLTDADLEKEKARLLKELKEKNNVSRNNKTKS